MESGEAGRHGHTVAHHVVMVLGRDTGDVTVHVHRTQVVNVSDMTPTDNSVVHRTAKVTKSHILIQFTILVNINIKFMQYYFSA